MNVVLLYEERPETVVVEEEIRFVVDGHVTCLLPAHKDLAAHIEGTLKDMPCFGSFSKYTTSRDRFTNLVKSSYTRFCIFKSILILNRDLEYMKLLTPWCTNETLSLVCHGNRLNKGDLRFENNPFNLIMDFV